MIRITRLLEGCEVLTYCTAGAGGKYMLSLFGSRAGLFNIDVGQSSNLYAGGNSQLRPIGANKPRTHRDRQLFRASGRYTSRCALRYAL